MCDLLIKCLVFLINYITIMKYSVPKIENLSLDDFYISVITET